VAAVARVRSRSDLAFDLKENKMRVDSIETPIGTLHFAVDGGALTALRFDEAFAGERASSEAGERLRAYLAGDVLALDAVVVAPEGSPFQNKVWDALREIPPGETITYGELARRVGSHPRAVGSANARNPIALAIPCHRVIAQGGDLCGYAWGRPRKQWLLDHERRGVRGYARLSVAG
jgi:methylated-DNA-[protein]-cysteine S-methyltransferase